MTGDVMALDDDVPKTLIYNLRTAESANLDDVIFTPPTIFIVRARSITLYTSTFTCISIQSFGWVDGARPASTSVLIHSQADNPWASELNSLELYSLSSFPPTLVSKILSRRRALRCTDVILDKRATPVWICPYGCETLIAAVFPGLLNPKAEVHVRSVCMNTLNDRTALDYDEDLGMTALRSGFGTVTIVQL
ncbi:uncharacterized protein ARMOST_20895 [Armillaria ostoyae]|uniref:Uncharacterized protein n=1 Tax=Armillaria ostoyae TaxID=47428 RepID=A0A284S8K2_ARMOS|nr:uncharacterized protein ARMOST_20895 [Armillaria ostoyae]